MRKNSIKNNRINGEYRREISELIRNDVKDPRIASMTTVTNVEVAPDLKTCKVYISVFGDDDSLDETVEGLRQAAGFIRHELAKRVNLRNTPALTFIPDRSIEYGVRMTKLIDDVVSDDRARSVQDDIDPADGAEDEDP
ncbi:MAG: 30S ribosome-binding factor RbfA [Lachnospiraceae bacterium]|nr:30S ribosome-binding factor RbfA [Lachnospiraceae bacterium]